MGGSFASELPNDLKQVVLRSCTLNFHFDPEFDSQSDEDTLLFPMARAYGLIAVAHPVKQHLISEQAEWESWDDSEQSHCYPWA